MVQKIYYLILKLIKCIQKVHYIIYKYLKHKPYHNKKYTNYKLQKYII